jgi:hypothetical protein
MQKVAAKVFLRGMLIDEILVVSAIDHNSFHFFTWCVVQTLYKNIYTGYRFRRDFYRLFHAKSSS